VSQKLTIRDLLRHLADAIEPAHAEEYRVWSVESSGLLGGNWPSGKLMDGNESPIPSLLEPSDETLADSLVDPGDSFAVEFQKNGKWIAIVNKSSAPKTEPASTPLFGQGNDFFNSSRFKPVTGAKATSTVSVGSSASPFLKPAAAIAKPVKAIPPGTLGLGNL
jgi:hypothetical protein